MSVKNVSGVVDFIGQRGKAYNIKVDGEWFGYGFKAPKFEKDANISFTANQKGDFWNVDADTVQILSAPAPKDVATNSAPSTGGSKDDYWAAKDIRESGRQATIVYQSARNAAIDFVGLAYNQGAITIPAKAKGDKVLDLLLDQVDLVTNRFYDATISVGIAEEAFLKVPEYMTDMVDDSKDVTVNNVGGDSDD